MSEQLVNGDYAVNENGDLAQVSYIDELLQSIKLVLTADNSKFYPNKNFGSQLKHISKNPIQEYALAYARRALDDMNGVFVQKATACDNGFVFDILINDEVRQVTIDIENNV